jgi:hypothetical protein
MSTQHARPWPAIDVAELRYGLAFGSSVEEIADFLQRDVDDVRHQMEVEAHKTAQRSAGWWPPRPHLEHGSAAGALPVSAWW